MRAKSIVYWVTTVIVALAMLFGGVTDLLHRQENVESMVHLGYPVYALTILGFWKVPGGIIVLLPRFPRVKEWVYAGAVFDFTGAVASHAACGDDVSHLLSPLVLAILALMSWALRPPSRRLGDLLAKTRT